MWSGNKKRIKEKEKNQLKFTRSFDSLYNACFHDYGFNFPLICTTTVHFLMSNVYHLLSDGGKASSLNLEYQCLFITHLYKSPQQTTFLG